MITCSAMRWVRRDAVIETNLNRGYNHVMTTVFLIRHGATVWSKEERFAGSTDVALSEEGRAQAKKLGERLAKEKIAAVYCSDLQRTVHTAEAVAGLHGLTPIRRSALREINHGHWEGMTHAEVERHFAAEYAAWDADPLLAEPPGGESGLAVMARCLPEFRGIVLAHPAETVAVISHKATNRLLLCNVLGIDPRLYRDRILQDTACLNILELFDGLHGRVSLMNSISHYVGP
jgi:broad specificity phosphatase PhoE